VNAQDGVIDNADRDQSGMEEHVAKKIPYSAQKQDLYQPFNEDAVFFPDGRPLTFAALCAELSRLTYGKFESSDSDKQKILGLLEGIGFDTTEFFSVTAGHFVDTQGFLTTDSTQNLSVLAFRGTEADRVTDLATDAVGWLTEWPEGGKVHKGFKKALLAVWPQIEQLLQRVVQGTLLFTGHSLGAALATLAASKHHPTALYTFGSPFTGTEEFTHTLAGVDVQRYVDCCDVVTRIPPEIFGYRHVGTLQYIDRSGVRTTNPTTDEIHVDRRQAREDYLLTYAWKIGTVALRDLADHAPINYVSGSTGR
jgi:hypothetical protein